MKYVLLVIAFVICLKPIIPFVEYVVDYDYISQVLCVNKDKPQMHCNGKCYLMRTLAKAAKEKKEEKLPVKAEFPLLFCEVSKTEAFHYQSNTAQKKVYSYLENSYRLNFYTSPFKPPIS